MLSTRIDKKRNSHIPCIIIQHKVNMASLCASVRLSSKKISPQPLLLLAALIVLLFNLSAVTAKQDNFRSSTQGIAFVACYSSTAARMIPTKTTNRSLLALAPNLNRFATRAIVMSPAVVRTFHGGATTATKGGRMLFYTQNQNVCHHPTTTSSALRAMSSSSSSSSSTLPTLEQVGGGGHASFERKETDRQLWPVHSPFPFAPFLS
jgi:hypothetical protein